MRPIARSQTSDSSTSWLLPLAFAGLGVLGWACQDGGGADASGDGATSDGDDEGMVDGEVTRGDVLASIANNVLVPSTADFVGTAESLQAAVQAYADAADPEEPLAAAQQAWRDAMVHWQQLELMQVGPAAPALNGIGGEDLRDAIYSWPTADTCSVDRALVDEAYAQDDFFTTQLVWAYGLDALEYLLFVHDADHTCPTQVQLDGPWAALSIEEIEQRRAQYARVVAQGIAAQASALAARWSPEGDDFAAALAQPGQGASPYASEAEALDEVFRAIFYVDKQTKDAKLGLPLGLVDGCPAVPCINLLESPWSAESTRAIEANLRALKLMVQGGADPETAAGFDDLLEGIGQPQIANDLLGRIDAAIAVAEGFGDPLQQAVASDPAAAEALHGAVKEVTDILKGPFVMALMLTIPAEGAGDAD
ncbi:MAG: imelysin family protein [Myxococcota bacterium]